MWTPLGGKTRGEAGSGSEPESGRGRWGSCGACGGQGLMPGMCRRCPFAQRPRLEARAPLCPQPGPLWGGTCPGTNGALGSLLNPVLSSRAGQKRLPAGQHPQPMGRSDWGFPAQQQPLSVPVAPKTSLSACCRPAQRGRQGRACSAPRAAEGPGCRPGHGHWGEAAGKEAATGKPRGSRREGGRGLS